MDGRLTRDEMIAEIVWFLEQNIADEERVAKYRHAQWLLDEPRWPDSEYEVAMTCCQVERNITTYARDTGNLWLLRQLANKYGASPYYSNAYTDGLTDEYQPS